MSWDYVKLGELITESRIPSEHPNPDRRITVRLNVLGVEKRALENEKAGATKQFIRKAGQFIYGKQNFHKGAFGIIPHELDGFESSADLPSFDVREDCLSEWIFYFFKQGGYYLELAKIARGVATQRIHPEQIYDLAIPLPDVETQKKIIASLKAIEDNGERLNKELAQQLSLLDNLNQAILQEAVQGKLLPQDPNDEPASELLKRIKAEKATLQQAQGKGKKEKTLPPIKPEEIPFEIPENWVWCRLGEVIELVSGQDFSPSEYSDTDIEGTPYLTGASNLDDGKIILNRWTKNPKSIAVQGDLLLTCKGSGVGKNALLKIDKAHIARQLMAIRPNIVDIRFLQYIIQLEIEQFKSKAKSQIPGIDRDIVLFTKVPIPPLSEQKRIVAEIEKQFAKTKRLKENIIANHEATEQLLKALLHQAFEVREVEV